MSRYEPSERLLNVFDTVGKIRSTLLAHKCSPQTLQVQTAVKQVPNCYNKGKIVLVSCVS